MSIAAMSGADSIIIDDFIVTDLADGDCVTLEFPEDIATVKTGKNGNSIYSLKETGKQAEVKFRVIRGGAADKFFNNKIAQQQNNFAGTVLANGQFIKKIGDGKGNITSDTYIMSGGIYTKLVPAKMNVDGDTEQSVAMYTIKFSNAPRVLT